MKQEETDTISVDKKQYQQLVSEHHQMKYELEWLKRQLFGKKSEKFISKEHPTQLSFYDLPLQQEKTEPTQEISYTRNQPEKKEKKERTESIPANLPRKTQIIEPENKPENARLVGTEVTETLEYKPCEIYVRRIERPKYVLGDTFYVAELPERFLPKSIAANSLLVNILVSKFVDHLPFYRIIEMFKRSGVHLKDATLNDWYMRISKNLELLYREHMVQILKSEYLQADESTIKVLESRNKAKTHRGYHWVVNDPHSKALFYHYHHGRGADFPQTLFANYCGALQTDGYAGYKSLNSNVTLLACWAHVRRKFEEALSNDPEPAKAFLELIQKLYHVERLAREQKLDALQRKELRQAKSKIVLEDIYSLLNKYLNTVGPKTPIGRAINYALSLWPRLNLYIGNGQYEIDNNLVENAIRPMTVGRKNYLFAGNDQAAQNAAMWYSFFGTCKALQVNPSQWLSYVLDNILGMNRNKIAELLPQNFANIQDKLHSAE